MASSPLLQAIIHGAVLKGKATGKTPVAVLEAVLLARFSSELSGGKTIISMSEAGGSTTFNIPGSFSPEKIAMLVSEAILWLKAQTDPEEPDLALLNTTRRIRGVFDVTPIPL